MVANRLIIPGGVDGAFGRGATFERVLEAFNSLVSRISAQDGAEVINGVADRVRTVMRRKIGLSDLLAPAAFSLYLGPVEAVPSRPKSVGSADKNSGFAEHRQSAPDDSTCATWPNSRHVGRLNSLPQMANLAIPRKHSMRGR